MGERSSGSSDLVFSARITPGSPDRPSYALGGGIPADQGGTPEDRLPVLRGRCSRGACSADGFPAASCGSDHRARRSRFVCHI